MKLDYIEIGIRVQSQRRRCKLTQSELAKKLGISPAQVSHIETGVTRPSLDVVAGICSSLNITADELIFGDKRPTIKKPVAPAATDNNSKADELPADIDSFFVDCPKMDQEIIIDVATTVKKGLMAARLNAYNSSQ